MTISTTGNQITYVGDGASLAFAFPYPFITTADLKVYLNGVLQVSGFSVAGTAPLGGSGTFVNGTVTFAAAPSLAAVILIYCDPDLLQSTSLPPNDPFPSKTVEKMVDKLTLLIQRVYSKFGNAITFPVGETTNGVLPDAASRASKLAGFDSAGNVTAVAPVAGTASALAIQLADATNAANGPGMVGFGILGYGASTVGGALFTTVWGAGATDRAAQLTAANALGLPIRIIGACAVNSPVTLTVPIVDTIAQIFASTAQITINNGLPVRPEWWGPSGTDVGLIRYAVNALPSSGGVVQLRVASYRSGYETALPAYFNNRGGTPGLDYMVKPLVRIQGSRLPSYNVANTALTDGSIIRGTLYVASEATGFQADLFGVDVGSAVCTAFYGGADHDGFCMLQVNKAAPVYGNYFRIGSVVTLGPGGATLGHGFLLESINGASVGYVEARLHYHGAVIKSQNVKCGTLVGTLNTGEEVLLKSDSYAPMANVTVDKVVGTGDVGYSSGYGFQVLASALNGGEVSIGQVVVDTHNTGVALIASPGFTLGDVNIGQMIIRGCPNGYQLTGATLTRTNVSRALINNFTSAVVVDSTVATKDHGIDSLGMAVGTYGVDSSGFFRVGDIHADTVTWVIYHRTGASRVYHAGGYTAVNVTNFWAATPALAGTWANSGVNDQYSMGSVGGLVRMNGLIAGGGTTTICTLPANIRPGANLRFACLAYNGAAWAVVELLVVAATGVVSISALAPVSSYLSLRGVAWEIPF